MSPFILSSISDLERFLATLSAFSQISSIFLLRSTYLSQRFFTLSSSLSLSSLLSSLTAFLASSKASNAFFLSSSYFLFRLSTFFCASSIALLCVLISFSMS
nr:MAG TPA: hypothetical protein [Caudoviricetes sp.]